MRRGTAGRGEQVGGHFRIELAIAFVIRRYAVAAAIDEINAPGVRINPTDNGWTQPALEARMRRR